MLILRNLYEKKIYSLLIIVVVTIFYAVHTPAILHQLRFEHGFGSSFDVEKLVIQEKVPVLGFWLSNEIQIITFLIYSALFTYFLFSRLRGKHKSSVYVYVSGFLPVVVHDIFRLLYEEFFPCCFFTFPTYLNVAFLLLGLVVKLLLFGLILKILTDPLFTKKKPK